MTKNIYVIEYKLQIEHAAGMWCQEKVRVWAGSEPEARSKVMGWALTTGIIWTTFNDAVVESHIPFGDRDVTIVCVYPYLEDVGELLQQVPLPEVFAHEG